VIILLGIIVKTVAYMLIVIAIYYKSKDLLKDENKDKHRDVVDLLLLALDIVLINYTKIG
jgi:hypothetical protein